MERQPLKEVVTGRQRLNVNDRETAGAGLKMKTKPSIKHPGPVALMSA